jgi:PBP superfamily domain
VALAIACLSLLVFASAHSDVARATVSPSDTSTGCAPEVATCSQQAFPCPGTCSATAGPVTNVGLNQAVYVDVTGIPQGDELEVAYCSLAGTGTQVVAQPQCASEVPGTSGNAATPTPLQYQYGTVTSSQTILAMPTEYDPNISGANPIVSQTSNQLFGNPNVNPPVQPGTSGTFFCDNASNPCAIEIMDIPLAEIQNAGQDGFAPQVAYSAVGHTVIFPLTFNQGGNGCGSAPVMQVDASYSVEQFLPAAGEATCTGPGGVAAVPTELPSVDDPGCATGTGTHCPIYDVIDGSVPATFTDDPEDPATIAELNAAGGKFAYIPIAASATEIAFSGAAGSNPTGGSSEIYPLSSYQLTPAMAAGVMTQLWTAATASSADTNDDLCGLLSGEAKCTETQQSRGEDLNVDVANGKTDNLDVIRATSLSSAKLHFDTYDFPPPDNFSSLGPNGGTIGTSDMTYYGDTGFTLLNPWPFDPGNITTTEEQLGAMWPSTASGASYATTSWMCQAPNKQITVPLPFGGTASVHDLFSGQQILADAELGPVAAANANKGLTPGVVDQHILYPANKCQALSSLPIDFAGNNSVVNSVYNPSSSPLTAAHVVLGAVPKYGGTGGFAFTAMDSSEADFFGLLPASLQNATGAFVGPSAQSIDAALTDATTNADGTLSPNLNDTADAGAYPLPMVTYALVSTSPQPTADQATQLKDLLTNLVTYSHNGGSASQPMPSGYVPLPQNLYNQAIIQIANITGTAGPGSGGSNGTPGSGGTGPATSAGAGGGAAGTAGRFTGATGRGLSSSGRGGGGHGAAPAGTPPSGSGTSSPGNFVGHLLTVTVGDSRFFVPALLLLALLCLIAGPVLYMSPTLRRPARPTGDGAADGDADGAAGASGPGPPEGG